MTHPETTHAPAPEVAVQEVAGTRARGESRFLRFVSEVSAPPIVVAVVLPILGLTSAAGAAHGLAWGLLGSLFVGLLPYGFIIWNVRRGRIKDRMLTDRRQRHIPNLVAIVSALVGLAIMIIGGAPVDVRAFAIAAILAQVVISLIALVWKMSLHLTTSSGVAIIAAILAGPWTLAIGVPLVALVAVSRLQLREHTRAQVIAGTTFGGALLSGFFLLFS